jgi:signal transduction histidine kinase
LRFTVVDDGPGFDPGLSSGPGTGLIGMADRLGAAGGGLAVESAPGHGTTVTGWVPVPPSAHFASSSPAATMLSASRPW